MNTDAAILPTLAKALRLPTISRRCVDLAETATAESWPVTRYLRALLDEELADRADRRIARLLHNAQLPISKTLAGFDWKAVPHLDRRRINALAQDPGWVERGDNLLLFGPSGVGKTHLAAGIVHGLIALGKTAKYARTTDLVQHLQAARAEHQLPKALARLDRFNLLILDDIGYARRGDGDASVLFELIAHRYERRSLIVTSNHAFSRWDEIFTDSSMTVATIDRLIHHAVILEIRADSYRRKQAGERQPDDNYGDKPDDN